MSRIQRFNAIGEYCIVCTTTFNRVSSMENYAWISIRATQREPTIKSSTKIRAISGGFSTWNGVVLSLCSIRFMCAIDLNRTNYWGIEPTETSCNWQIVYYQCIGRLCSLCGFLCRGQSFHQLDSSSGKISWFNWSLLRSDFQPKNLELPFPNVSKEKTIFLDSFTHLMVYNCAVAWTRFSIVWLLLFVFLILYISWFSP